MKDQALHAVRLASLVAAAATSDQELLLAEIETESAGRCRALAVAVGDRVGGPSRPARCRRSLRSRAFGAARVSAC